ncbi:MAG TPA: endolytic transglycosylase MltG [Bacilli bacterium]|jgi:UPF0755 protein|nr:endolytic transglycosylase MltG [Bacilli bacterium]
MNNTDLSTDHISKIITKIVGIIFIVFIAVVIVFSIIMGNAFLPVDNSSTETEKFIVNKGETINQVIESLEDENLIKNAFFIKLYLKFYSISSIQAGTYDLSKNMDTMSILDKLSNGECEENETYSITLIEGKRFTYYAKQIADKYSFNYDDIISTCSDPTYLAELKTKYWFITDDIENSNIYYPLEGYIFPDTYNIKKTATIKEVIETMLDEMETKLEPYKTDISTSNKSVHSLLTLASMVELEAVSAEDRKVLAGVFTNRLTLGMTLGSDVTTYYAVQKDMTDDLTLSDLATCNGYNTRGTCVPGLPVGPIASPSLSSIQAAVNPDSTDYLYFVADKNSKLYFAKTLDEHNNNIAYLKSHDLWLS